MSVWSFLFGVVAVCASSAAICEAANDPCADRAACCQDPAACVIADEETLAGLSLDATVPPGYRLGQSCAIGAVLGGVSPNPAGSCGLSGSSTDQELEAAINLLDHRWVQTFQSPTVLDFGSAVNTVIVFPAIDHTPIPEEGIEYTVWGSDSCDTTGFPSAWTLATLTTIYKRGWEDPAECSGQVNTDDFSGQYSFPGQGFRYVAVYANYSISIFEDASHATWPTSDDEAGTRGWQSYDDEIDAVGTPACGVGDVVADAGPDQLAYVGGEICFDGSRSSAVRGIGLYGWDFDSDGALDANGATPCKRCNAESESDVTLFVTDTTGCVDTDQAHFRCSCGADTDGDGIGDFCDNCPFVATLDRPDTDEDGIGDACDNCPFVASPDNADTDEDDIGDACDNCKCVPNADLADAEGDGIGDACDLLPTVGVGQCLTGVGLGSQKDALCLPLPSPLAEVCL